MASRDRIDGWKAIGAHFGRDRSTVMRWAQTRGLPVRRMPGGKTSTVYALKSELDVWASANPEEPAANAEHRAAPAPDVTRAWTIAAALCVLALAGFGAWAILDQRLAPPEARAIRLPSDPDLASKYMSARDDWAQRTPEALNRAITTLEEVTRRDPDFAPGFAALADTYLLASEFGDMADEEAFAKARNAAATSIRLDGRLADGHRAMGFIHYWWDNDPPAAGAAFRRALELAPNSAQTHFWYGNILSDNGRHAAAARELDRARLLQPGSIAMQNDTAWADWRAGRHDVAEAALVALTEAHPDYSAGFDALAVVRLSERDYPGYVAAYSRYAHLRAEPSLIAHAEAQQTALRQGSEALEAVMLRHELDRAGFEIGRNRARVAFVASIADEREILVDILAEAEARGERWGSSGELGRMEERWADDAEISALLANRRPQPVE